MSAKVQVIHATSPLCSWSWGYEPVINRLEMLYGDQIEVVVAHALPYTDREQWLVDYDMTKEEAIEFSREVIDIIGMPCYLPREWSENPASCLPAAVAVKAAGVAFGPRAERKLARRLMHAFFVERRDTSDEKVLADVVQQAGLDLARVLEVAGTEAPERALEEDAHRAGHGSNFYSLLVRDGEKTTVVLEHAYDPARVERAIEYLAGGPLARTEPTDVLAYAHEHGAVCAAEVARVFAMPEAKARDALEALERKGSLVHRDHPGLVGGDARFWSPKGV